MIKLPHSCSHNQSKLISYQVLLTAIFQLLVFTMSEIVNNFRPDLGQFEAVYKSIHANAELSRMERNTARVMADHLLSLGFQVTQDVGGTGVVGVLHNGEGRCVMLRAELDALPVREETDVPYKCYKTMKDIWGREQPAMHTAGHDLHMASLLAAAKLMRNAKSHWRGSLVVVFQPAKVHSTGAQAMVDHGLYNIAPVPDAIFAQHSGPYPAGHINVMDGPALMSADIVKIKLYCSLGYRANPQYIINPVTLASRLIDEVEKLAANIHSFAYIAVEQIHAGHPGQNSVKHVDLVLDVRTYDGEMRQNVLTAIGTKAEKVCHEAAVKDPPEVEIFSRAPLTLNDTGLAGTLRQSFGEHFGEDKVRARPPLSMACDDFSRLAAPHGIPYLMWHLGRQGPSEANFDESTQDFTDKIPYNDSPHNAPVIWPTLQTGTDALALAALSLLSSSSNQTYQSDMSESDDAYESEVTIYSQ